MCTCAGPAPGYPMHEEHCGRSETELSANEIAVIEALERMEGFLRRRERDMSLIQGESPRPDEVSEAHYTGWRKGLLNAADELAAYRKLIAS